MATKKFTLLELHLGDGTVQIGPATLGAGDASDGMAGYGADMDDTDDESGLGRTVGKLLLAFVVLALLAAVVRAVLGDDENLDELEDLADLD